MKISELIQDDRNLNLGTERGRELLERSIQEYGAGRSILIDRNGRIISGNKTVLAAIKEGIVEVEVVESTGKELIAVLRIGCSLQGIVQQWKLLWITSDMELFARAILRST